MPTGVNKANVRAFFDTANREKSMKSFPRYAAADYMAHFPGMEADIPTMIDFGESFFAAMPDMAMSYEDVFAEGDLVGLRLTIRGTHTGPFQTPAGTIPATNKRISFMALNVIRMTEDGKVAEHWPTWDTVQLARDLGGAPPVY